MDTVPVETDGLPPYHAFPGALSDHKPDRPGGNDTVADSHAGVTNGADFKATFGLHDSISYVERRELNMSRGGCQVITVQIDSFEDCIPELKPLFQVHHVELGLFRDAMPLDPDYREYVRRERAGELFLCTARRNGTLVAYYVAVVRPGFHYRGTLTGTADIYYVDPEFRGKGLALPLFRHTEQELKRRGVQVWYSGGKVHNPLGTPKLHELLGFTPADVYYAKWLGAS